LIGVCLVSLGVLLATGSRADAQKGQGKYVTQTAERLARLVNEANGDGYKLANNKFSIGGGWLKQGKEFVALYTIPMEEGRKYRVIAAGDNDATDVDVEVLDAKTKDVLKKDVKTDPEAVVDFTAPGSGRYLVRVRVYASRNDVPCVCMAIVMER
jgi:hypothetical protein